MEAAAAEATAAVRRAVSMAVSMVAHVACNLAAISQRHGRARVQAISQLRLAAYGEIRERHSMTPTACHTTPSLEALSNAFTLHIGGPAAWLYRVLSYIKNTIYQQRARLALLYGVWTVS